MNKLFDNIYDISVTLGKESINFPRDITFSRDFAIEHPGYKGTNHNYFTMGDIQYASNPILKAQSHGDESV